MLFTEGLRRRKYLTVVHRLPCWNETLEVQDGSYVRGLSDTVPLVAGQPEIEGFGKSIIILNVVSIIDRAHVNGLNETLMSVGYICDFDKIVVFSKNQAVVLEKSKFTVNEDDIISIADRDQRTGIYESNNATNMAYSTKLSTGINLWHGTLSHTNVKILHALPDNCSDVLNICGNLGHVDPTIRERQVRRVLTPLWRGEPCRRICAFRFLRENAAQNAWK